MGNNKKEINQLFSLIIIGDKKPNPKPCLNAHLTVRVSKQPYNSVWKDRIKGNHLSGLTPSWGELQAVPGSFVQDEDTRSSSGWCSARWSMYGERREPGLAAGDRTWPAALCLAFSA